MSLNNWISPVEIVDSKVLGLNLTMADGFSGGETFLSITMNSSFAPPKLADGNRACKCVLEAVGNWSIDEGGLEPAFSASCKLGIVVSIPEASLSNVQESEREAFVMANTVSIAYGKIRAVVESITAESAMGKQTLPAIDPYGFVASLRAKVDSEGSE
ncbi:hypothetical protein [uncultured Senegalimassilia sp.]|uniref:hypothetical protein n=1 Tax=uncultured Senegalimassilia sp. TaxID=1714350 RepID=UPI002676CB16|nr:hypothetical protein [uncultured Senegalimassilia sp.]